jgi:hypothetical protein
MLTYADVCWRMLTYADADVCWQDLATLLPADKGEGGTGILLTKPPLTKPLQTKPLGGRGMLLTKPRFSVLLTKPLCSIIMTKETKDAQASSLRPHTLVA